MKKRLLLLLAAIAIMTCIVFSLSSCDFDNFIPHEHTFGDWYGNTATCTKEGTEERKCSKCDYTETRDTAPLGHDEILIPKKLPTCEEDGYEEYFGCSRCEEYGDRNIIEALGHTIAANSPWITTEAPPTCERDGYILTYRECAVCEKKLDKQKEILPKGHDEIVNVISYADCTTAGEMVTTCSRCNYKETVITNATGHTYSNLGKCTVCGTRDPNYVGSGEWWDDISYDETNLIFQMTHCSNQEELSSGCERYLAGESADNGEIDKLVDMRNEAAYVNTNVNVSYRYYDDIPGYGFSQMINTIYNETLVPSSTSPDIYCNFMTDMFVASLKGSFANLYSTKHGEDDYVGKNYFDIQDDAYMADLMASLTLSLDKIYLIASDYFIDLIRAFYVVPVNVKLYNSIASSMIDDLNCDGVTDFNDFYEAVWAMEWTYTRLAEYCAVIYKEGEAGVSGASIDDTLGFALGKNGLPAAGLVYSSSVVLIHKTWNESRGDYDYAYPQENEELYALSDAVNNLFNSRGVMCIDGIDAASVGATTANLGVRTQFTKDKILFGGIILLGSIEYEAYQRMKGEDTGFGLVPVPLYRDGSDDNYLTQIHVLGRAGAIARGTRKFVQCSAFLQYQTEHSDDVLNEYYEYNLTYAFADGLDGNVDMLKYMRENVRTAFDRMLEDAIGYMYLNEDLGYPANRWHTILCDNDYKINLREAYKAHAPAKHERLAGLIKQYEVLPE